jgi:hypothetical protein
MEGLRKPWEPACSVLKFGLGVSHTVLTAIIVTLTAGGDFETVLKCFSIKKRKGKGSGVGLDTQKDKSNEEGVSN